MPITNSNSNFLKNTLKVLTGNILGQIIIIATIPIITRIYPPEMFGFFALFVSLSQFFTSFTHLRYANAILKPRNDIDAASIFWLSIVAGFCLNIFGWMLGWILPANMFSEIWRDIREHLNILFISSYIGCIILTLNFWLIRKKYFSPLGIAKVVEAISSRTAIITLGVLFNVSSIWLVLSFITGQLVSLVTLSSVTIYNERSLLGDGLKIGSIKSQALKFRSFALYSPSVLFNSARREFPILAMAFFFDPVLVGYFALCQRVVGKPLDILGDAIARSFFQKAAELHHQDKRLDKNTAKLLRFQLLLTVTPCVLMAIVSQELFVFIFGNEWQGAGAFFQLVWPLFLCPFVFRPLSILYDLYGQQREYFVFNVFLFVFSTSGFLLGVTNRDPNLAILLFVIINVVFYSAAIIILLGNLGHPALLTAKIFMESFTYALVFGICAWTGKYFLFSSDLEVVLFAIMLGGIFLIVIAKKMKQIMT